jgi:hypothetical protein
MTCVACAVTYGRPPPPRAPQCHCASSSSLPLPFRHPEPDGRERIWLTACSPLERCVRLRTGLWKHQQASTCAGGNVIVKRVSPGIDCTLSVPQWRFTIMCHAILSPRPVPSPIGLVVKNGSKMRSQMLG